jgi:hypothetical protein
MARRRYGRLGLAAAAWQSGSRCVNPCHSGLPSSSFTQIAASVGRSVCCQWPCLCVLMQGTPRWCFWCKVFDWDHRRRDKRTTHSEAGFSRVGTMTSRPCRFPRGNGVGTERIGCIDAA